MNLIDFFIVYLAVGAPFGIYYFFTNRFQTTPKQIWIRSFLTFIFWIPFCIFLLSGSKGIKKSLYRMVNTSTAGIDRRAKSIDLIQKEIEKIYSESDAEISIYELRETIERYTGLTLALKTDEQNICLHEKEIFEIAVAQNPELGATCLNRRNRKRLTFHQNYARKDFLYLIKQLTEADSDKARLEQQAIKLADFLEDTEAKSFLLKIFAELLQTDNRPDVQNLEKDLWKTEIRKPLPAQQI